MKLFSFQAQTLDIQSMTLLWEPEDSAEDPYANYQVQVQRSESARGPFEVISPWFRGWQRFVDPNVPQGYRYRQAHYRLAWKNLETGETGETHPVTLEPDTSPVALELRRHFQVLARQYEGRRCWVFPIRTRGRRCPHCYDSVQGQRVTDYCPNCFGTSFLGGYLHPIECFISIDPSGSGTQVSQSVNLQANNTTARMACSPTLKQDDLIVEKEGHRWRVMRTSTAEFERATIRQFLDLEEVLPTDIDMTVPLNLEEALEDVWATPALDPAYPPITDTNGHIDAAIAGFFGLTGVRR